MKLGSLRGLAKELDCQASSLSALRKKKPHLFEMFGNKIDFEKTIPRILESGFGSRQSINKAAAKRKKERELNPVVANLETTEKTIINELGPEAEQDFDIDELKIPLSPNDDRSRIDKHKAFHQSEKERIANAIKEKQLVELEKVEHKFFDIARRIRDGIEAIAPRISGSLVGKTKHEIEIELTKECKRVLLNLSDDIV